MAEERIELILPDDLAGSRLDGALAEAVRDRGYSRSRIGKGVCDTGDSGGNYRRRLKLSRRHPCHTKMS